MRVAQAAIFIFETCNQRIRYLSVFFDCTYALSVYIHSRMWNATATTQLCRFRNDDWVVGHGFQFVSILHARGDKFRVAFSILSLCPKPCLGYFATNLNQPLHLAYCLSSYLHTYTCTCVPPPLLRSHVTTTAHRRHFFVAFWIVANGFQGVSILHARSELLPHIVVYRGS